MYKFSVKSLKNLETCDTKLVSIFWDVAKGFNCTVLEGRRDEHRQNYLLEQGKTQVRFPDSKHNKEPSQAVDVAPYPIDWNDWKRFYYFAGFVKGIALIKKIPLRWGGDWDCDNEFHDQTFMDLVHFELIDEYTQPNT